MDGTIADTLPLCVAAFRESIARFIRLPVSDHEIMATFGPTEEGTIRHFIPAHFDEGVAAYLEAYQRLHPRMCPEPFDGMRGIFELLKMRGIHMGIVTGKGLKSLMMTLDFFSITNYFNILEPGSPHGPDKPNGMRRIMEKLSISPFEVLYIGDSPSDIHASREVQIPVFAAAWAQTAEPRSLEALHPDRLLYSVSELRETLLEIL